MPVLRKIKSRSARTSGSAPGAVTRCTTPRIACGWWQGDGGLQAHVAAAYPVGQTINLRAAAAPLLRVRRSRGHAAARVGLRALVLGPLTVASAVPRAAVPTRVRPNSLRATLRGAELRTAGAHDIGSDARHGERCVHWRPCGGALRHLALACLERQRWGGVPWATAAKTARLSRILPKSSWHERSVRPDIVDVLDFERLLEHRREAAQAAHHRYVARAIRHRCHLIHVLPVRHAALGCSP